MKTQLRAIAAFLPTMSLLFVFAAFFFPDDPDLGYHLTIGNQILNDYTWPLIDNFRTDSGVIEVAYSWLPEVLLALSYKYWGVFGLRIWLIISLCLLSAISVLLIWDRRQIWQSAIFLFLLSLSFLQLATPRPRIWSALFLALLFLILKSTREQNTTIAKRALLISLIVIVWANSHITVVLSPAIIFCYCYFEKIHLGVIKALPLAICYSLIAAVVLLFNPYGAELYRLGFVFSPTAQQHIAPLVVELAGFLKQFPGAPIWAWAGGLIALPFLAACFSLSKKIFKDGEVRQQLAVRFALISLASLFLLLTLESSRHLPFFCITVCALLGEFVQQKRTLSPPSVVMGLLVFIFAVSVGLYQADNAKDWYDPRYATSDYAHEALKAAQPFIERISPANGQHVILTQFGLGHFTTWWLYEHQLSKRAKLVIDGRSDEVGLRRFFAVQSAYRAECYDEVIAQFHVTVILVHVADNLFDALSANRDWVAVGGDKIVAFVAARLLEDI